MGFGLLLGVFETLSDAVQTPKAREQLGRIERMNYRSEVILGLLKYVLLNAANSKHDLPGVPQHLLEMLKGIVYDGDDLFDELINTPTVRRLLSDIQDWRKLLFNVHDDLRDATEMTNINRVFSRREETSCYVEEVGIIGRKEDKEALVEMLLSCPNPSSNSHSYDDIEHDLSVVAIVGMAGLGKTALAQLVYNDERIKCHFAYMLWVCVSDHSGDFDLKIVLRSIVGEISELPLDEMMRKVRQKLCGRRFILVLDGVWCEDRSALDSLRSCLNVGYGGSWMLVTTQSRMVADAFGATRIHELKALSDKDSWNLFKRLAFHPEDDSGYEVVQIANEVTEKCANLPLAIIIMAKIFHRLDKWEWLSFKTGDLVDLAESLFKDEIMPHLWLSYHQLTPELKSCFEFCSIFPKDYVIQRQVLISMWTSMGIIRTSPTMTCTMDEFIGEQYCSILLGRSIFQPIQQDEYGKVISFKMHDVMRLLAQQSAGTECLTLTAADADHLPWNIRHISISEYASFDNVLRDETCRNLRTIFSSSGYSWCSPDGVATIISKCMRLRILHLHNMGLTTLPDTFNKVPHLRYLDLSDNKELQILPASITNLGNLQTLRLSGCKNLKELPEGMGKLVKLINLNIDGCNKLTCMPAGLNNLTRLQTLPMFVVSGDDSIVNKGQLRDLKTLVKLRGDLHIKLGLLPPSSVPNTTEEADVVKNAHLQALKVTYADGSSEVGDVHKTLLESLYPNRVLNRIVIEGFQGITLPRWASVMTDSVPNLVNIKLSQFHGLKHLTALSKLCHLKYLYLRKMRDVECIEIDAPSTTRSRATESMIFFPSLEKLVLEWMPNLKGWWKDVTWMEMEVGGGCLVDDVGRCVEQLILPSFPRLHDLKIHCCPTMMYIPPCPHVKSLELKGVNKAMKFCMKGGNPTLCLEKLTVYYDARVFESVVREFVVPGTVDVNLKYFYEEQSLGIAREAFQRCAASLRNLSVDGFYKLKSLCGGVIEHLTNLQSLSIVDCSELDLKEVGVEGDEGMPWKSLQSLSSLTLDRIPKLVNLPQGFQYLTSLQSLRIISCKNFDSSCMSQFPHISAITSYEELPQEISTSE